MRREDRGNLRCWCSVAVMALAGLALGCSDSPAKHHDGGTDAGGGIPDAAAGAAGSGSLAGAGGSPAGAAGAGGGVAGAAGAGGVAGAGGAAGASVLAPPAPAGLAALNADAMFETTSLSLLDAAGGLGRDDCIDSRITSDAAAALISNDVVLPSQPQRGGKIVLVDRGDGALTSVDPTTCKVVRQVAVPNGMATKVHDVVIASDSKAYVTRFSLDATATAAAAMGNDVAVIDPVTGAFQARINLDAYASTVTGATILVRPARALIAAGKIVVSLDEADAAAATYGEGKVVLLDPTTDTVTASVALTGLSDCQAMDYLAASQTLLVACGGPHLDPDAVDGSGIAVVDLGASPPSLTGTVTGAAFGGQVVSAAWVLSAPTAAGATRAFASGSGPTAARSDGLYVFDFASGIATQIATSDPHSIGRSAATASLLFVPEFLATSGRVQLYDITSTPVMGIAFASAPGLQLPPTEIAWY